MMTDTQKSKPHYRYWDQIPEEEGLATRTTLNREGLKLAPNQEHVATVSYGRGGENLALLYRRSEAIPKRPLTAAQQEGLEKARQTRKEKEERAWQQEFEYRERIRKEREEKIHQDNIEAEQECKAEALVQLLTFESMHPRETWRIIDTETTGLEPYGEVISLSIVDGYGQVLYDQLFRPVKYEIEDSAFRIHGISMQDLQGKPTFAEQWHHIAPLLQGQTLMAFNASFDRGRLSWSLALDRSPQWPSPDGILQNGGDWICLMDLASTRYGYPREYRGYFDGFYWLNLNEACWKAAMSLGKLPTLRPRHQASADALSALELLNNMIEHARRERDGGEVHSPDLWMWTADARAAGLEHCLDSGLADLVVSHNGQDLGREIWKATFRMLPKYQILQGKFPDLPFSLVKDWWESVTRLLKSGAQPRQLGPMQMYQDGWSLRLEWGPERDDTD